MNVDILIKNQHIATLTHTHMGDKYELQYSNDWEEKGFGLSPFLPLDGSFDSIAIKTFFANILPEGDALEEIASFYHLSQSNVIGFIEKIGNDLPGALRLVTQNSSQSTPETLFREIPIDELTNRIANRDKTSLIFWDGNLRLSLAGVQDKLPVLYRDGKYGFGDGELASTHILKFEKKGDHNLVLNEFLSLQLAKALKINVVEHELKYFKDEPALLVKRFDRKDSGASVDRIHAIDGCQALNILPQFKYQRMYGSSKDVKHILGPANFKNFFNVTNKTDIPVFSKAALIDMAIFNVLISNSDAHAKNTSYLVGKNSFEVAPLYDLVNISMYPNYEQELAMSFGEQFNMNELSPYDFALFCDECEIQPKLFAKRLKTISDSVGKELEKVIVKNNFATNSFLSSYTDSILQRAKKMAEISLDIEDVYRDFVA
jgi:serine/threonine-protein kinase HipA